MVSIFRIARKTQHPVFDLPDGGGRTGETKPLTRQATMPSAQNWTFCRAFSLLDAAHVSKGGAPLCARVRYSTRIAERDAGSRPGASGLCCATTLLPYPRVARGAGRLPSPGSSAGCWGTLCRLGPPAMTGSPRSPPTSLGAGALAWAAGLDALAPRRSLRAVAAPLRLRALAL